MKFLADENIPLASISVLQAAGHDIFSIASHNPGIDDLSVWNLAATHQAILLTFDRDFGHLMIKNIEPKPAGILYCRFIPSTATETAEIILKALENQVVALEGNFTTLEKDRLRSRKM